MLCYDWLLSALYSALIGRLQGPRHAGQLQHRPQPVRGGQGGEAKVRVAGGEVVHGSAQVLDSDCKEKLY